MSQILVTGEAKIRDIQGPVVANSGVVTALDGDASQYVRGDGTLADFPTSTGGGSSVSYYLNSSVSQGTIGGVAYKQLSKTPISGAGTDITASTNGYIASYITDANDPALLEVPAGNFNCEFYFSVNSNAHNPYVYAELYKYDGTTFTLLGSNVAIPEYLTNGTTLSAYYFAIPVSVAALTITDRLAIRIYVNVDGRVVTLHTENNYLCQVVTTFSKGLISLNNLTRQNQFFATGTSGTDFAISSSTATHTFNLPVASATNTGKLSSTDWSTFNGKQPAGNYVTLDTTQTITAAKTFSLDILVNSLTIGRGAGSIASNTAIGSSSLPVNTTGTLNTAIGNFSLLSNTTGYGNTSVGHTALGYNTTGFFNAAIGVNTLLSNTTGTYNNALGTAALYNNTTGSYNTAIGQVAGTNNTTGSNNTYIGNGSGGGITTGSNNTIIGAFNGTAALANNIVLADGAGNVRYQWDGTNNVFGNPISGTSASFSSSITASSLVKSGGTSSQFLMADGSVNTSVLPSGAYLPLTGGTLTGALSGTSATFSGGVSADVGSAIPSIQVKNVSTDAPFIGFYRGGTLRNTFQLLTDGSFRLTDASLVANAGLTMGALSATTATFSSSVTANSSGSLFNANTGGLSANILTIKGGGGSGAFGFRVEANNGDAIFRTNNFSYNVLMCENAGSVGIGTSSPSSIAKLDILLDATAVNGLQIRTSDAGTVDGSTTANVFRTVNSSAGNWANAKYNAWDHIFTTSGTAERMRITSGGNVGIGAADSIVRLNIVGASATSSNFAFYVTNSTPSPMFFIRNDGYMSFGLEANSPYNIAQSGRTCILASNGSVGYLSSTRESKTNIENLSDISWLYQLNPVSFNYRKKDDENNYTNQAEDDKWYGLIADEVESVNEDLVFYKTKEDKTKELAGVEYNKLIAALVKSVQELKAEIDELKNK